MRYYLSKKGGNERKINKDLKKDILFIFIELERLRVKHIRYTTFAYYCWFYRKLLYIPWQCLAFALVPYEKVNFMYQIGKAVLQTDIICITSKATEGHIRLLLCLKSNMTNNFLRMTSFVIVLLFIYLIHRIPQLQCLID